MSNLKLYIDTSLIYEPIRRMLVNEKPFETEFTDFLIGHPEIERTISIFTVAEIVENLLFREKRILEYKRNIDAILTLVKVIQNTYSIDVIEYEIKDGQKGFFVLSDLIALTGKLGNIKDAIHVCIAKHENLMLVSHEDKFGVVKDIYKNIATDRQLFKGV